jgi:hypothetical protein
LIILPEITKLRNFSVSNWTCFSSGWLQTERSIRNWIKSKENPLTASLYNRYQELPFFQISTMEKQVPNPAEEAFQLQPKGFFLFF